MDPLIVGAIGLASLVVLMFLRMPIAMALAIVGFFGVAYFSGFPAALSALATVPYAAINMYVWTTVPLFVFMGYLAQHTKLAEEFYEGVRRWLGHFRGGLATTVIVGNTGFGACSGNPIGAAVTFTLISLPEMRRYKYADTLTLGSVAAGAVLANLIPPSVGFIIIGAITATSIGHLFIAGIFPGLLLAALYIVVIYVLCQRNPTLGPPGPRTTFREKLGAATGMWALIGVFVVIIGGIYLGLFTPTEAGAAASFVVLVLGLVRRKLSWQGFKLAIRDTGVTTGMVGFLLIGCMVFNLLLVVTGLPAAIATFVGGITQSPVGILLIIVGVYFALGTIIEALALVLLTVPIFFPIAIGVGVDPVLFGVVVTTVTTMGALTPPFGIIVYAMSGAAKDVPLFDIFRGVGPFLIAMMICVLSMVFLPQIVLFLPSTMGR